MRRRSILLLVLFLLSFAPVSVAKADLVCDGKAPVAARTERLKERLAAYLQGKEIAEAFTGAQASLPACIRLTKLEGGTGLLAWGRPDRGTGTAVFAWNRDGGWQLASVDVSRWGGEGIPTGGIADLAGDKPSLLLAGAAPGAEGASQVLHAQMDPSGTLRVAAATAPFDHAQFDFLDPHLVLVTYRGDGLGPLAWTCNTCLPVNHQRLLRWEGDRGMQVVGERLLPEPFLSATLFLGALQAGSAQDAARYAADTGLAERVARELGLPHAGGFPWQTADGWTEGNPGTRVRDLEQRNWSLIPAQYRTRLPEHLRSYTVAVTRGGEKVLLQITRHESDWLITGTSRP